jgi:Zn-dependent M28 family amino/carboxypeptidase
MHRPFMAIVAVLLAHELLAQSVAPGNDTIRKQELRADLFFVASEAMRGRLTDTPENRVTTAFVRSRFERLGLEPMGSEGSYFQPFRLITARLATDNDFELLDSRGSAVRWRVRRDFSPELFSASGGVEAEAVFVGFGIHAPSLGHDDYASDAVRGKIAMVLDHEPGERDPVSPFDGVVASEFSNARRKALAAQSAGAVGILFVTDVHNHPEETDFARESAAIWDEPPPRIRRYTLARWAEAIQIPAVQISPALADSLLVRAGRSLGELAREAESTIEAVPVPSTLLRLQVDVERQVVMDRNVVAAMRGSDPSLSDEWVIVSSHFDHNGADGDDVFNGADDDGSGTVALLEIAEAYAQAKEDGGSPRRSVLFASWGSEERGLLGSWAYAESPIVPLARTVAVLNMDMIGRNEEVPVGGGRRFRGLDVQTAESNDNAVNILGYTYSDEMKTGVEEANRLIELELKMRYDNNASNLLRRSDQWPFLQKGVPSLFFHTGLHPDYHTVFDIPEKINYDKLERITKLVHQMSWELAQSDARPSFEKYDRIAAPPETPSAQ